LFDYQLLDFGGSRKLESLSGYVIDRPSPAAESECPLQPELWKNADARFDENQKSWTFRRPWPADIWIDGDGFRLPLRPTPYGHIGAFPEQKQNWQWLAQVGRELSQALSANKENPGSIQAMNLFAHTGGSTLALAQAGAAVAHVDAAKPNVIAAREAANANGFSELPIRYIVDDAVKFTVREGRRKRRYDIVVLDPPAYGHSPDGKAWRIQRDLWPLLDSVLQLVKRQKGALLVTGHTAGIDQQAVVQYIKKQSPLRDCQSRLHCDIGRSELIDPAGRKLDAGFFVRIVWSDEANNHAPTT
jgi:23S rRNA (cytosine1962-C5)-methyltransferase